MLALATESDALHCSGATHDADYSRLVVMVPPQLVGVETGLAPLSSSGCGESLARVPPLFEAYRAETLANRESNLARTKPSFDAVRRS